MRIDAITTFPNMFDSIMGESMMKRAQASGTIDFKAHDLREWTHDRHRTTDDDPYGGGPGLIMKCEPIYEALSEITSQSDGVELAPHENFSVIIPAPQGSPFDDDMAAKLANQDHLVFICGHYEGIDERIYSFADEVISIGDYVLTSGELAAMVIIDATVRKIPGVLGATDGPEKESFATGLLEEPQYTRPSEFLGMKVPDVLLSGDHAAIEKWRLQQSLERTKELRPDLYRSYIDAHPGSDKS